MTFRSFTKFKLQSKNHCLIVQLICPLLFLQFSTEGQQTIHQSLQFALIENSSFSVDITIEVQLADLLAFKQSVLKASFTSSEVCTVNHTSYYFVYLHV